MPTIIDALLVTLSLDPSQFNTGSKQVDKSLKDTKDSADRTAKDMEAKGKVAAQFFAQIRNQVIALAATFTAGAGLKTFVDNVTTADAAVGRTAKNIGISTEVLTAWQGVAARSGGSAEGMAGSMQSLSQQFQQLALTGQSQVVPYFRAAGVALADSAGRMRPMSQILLDVAGKFSKMDPARAHALGRGMTFDEGTVNVLMHSAEALKGLLAEQEKLGRASAADADAAAKRQSAFRALGQASEQLGRILMTTLTPAINTAARLLTGLAAWLQQHQVVFGIFAAAIGAAALTLTTALTVLSFKGFLGLIATLAKVPAAAAAAATGMETAAAASSGGLVKMLFGLAKGATLLAAAGGVGYAIGTAIWAAVEDTKVGDKIGEWVTRAMASLGSTEAKEALAIQQRGAAAKGLASKPTTAAPKDQAQRDVDTFVRMGWTREQAAGIVANIQAESAGNERAVGDGGAAVGLIQWHPDRQREFSKLFGHDIRKSSRDEQLEFINFELREGREKNAGRALSRATDAGQAAAIYSKKGVRPADAEGAAAKRAGIATSLLTPGPRVDPAMAAGAATSVASKTTNNTTTHSSTSETHVGTVNVTLPSATDADTVAKGLGPAMKKNFSFAAQANYSLA